MHLKHSFVIPAGVDATWAHFQDISGVAECFPGATVTSAEGDDFQGTAKVKLGPVALQYSGSGSFIERDEAARRMVFEAKGRDKRGNGTAGATVTLSFSDDPGGTKAEVDTDLSVTGKPAQFGARMMQEVSDKLLGQFVECLQQQVGAAGSPSDADETATATTASTALAAQAASPESAAGASTVGGLSDFGSTQSTGAMAEPSPVAPTGGGRPSDDALDLGSTVLPVVARLYRKHIGAVLVLLLVLWVLRRRLR